MTVEPLLTSGMPGDASTSTLEGTRVENSVPSRVRATPVLTITLLVANVVVFVLMTVAGGASKPVVLIASGALVWPIFRLGDYGTVLTSAFIHLGVIHLLVNMTALWSMGRALEGVLGAARYALVYFTSAITGSLLSICFIHRGASAGAWEPFSESPARCWSWASATGIGFRPSQ
jgi:membrane associated rhomboid family serine protease